MKPKKEALGKGIRALLDNIDSDVDINPKKITPSALSNTIIEIPLKQIDVNPFQPRTEFDKTALNELSQSIKTHGVVQPITVRKVGANKFQLIAGERRVRASKLAGLTIIPAYIRLANDQEMLEIGLVENIQREDLNAVEVAITYKRLIDECKLKQEELAQRVGKERSTVTNYLRLLKLPPEVQLSIKNKKITMGHARALISIDNPATQITLHKEIIANKLSVRETEALARNYSKNTSGGKKTSKVKSISPAIKKIQDNLSTKLGTKVLLKTKNGNSGEININFYSKDDLDRILEILND